MSKARVLVISAHSGEMDRRIIAEANALVESGRDVTLVSVPTRVPDHCLHPQVRLVMPRLSNREPNKPRGWLHSLVRNTARTAGSFLRPWIWSRRLETQNRFFLETTPRAAYEAIHCHDLDTLPAAQMLRKSLAPHAKLIYDAHELYPFQVVDSVLQRFWSRIEKEHIRVADLVITVNEALADQLAAMYGIDRPAVIFNSYGNTRQAEPLPVEAFYRHFGAAAGGFRSLFQGSLSPLRNLPNLVRAFAHLDSSFRLFVLGSGPVEQEIRHICARERIGNVAFGGHVPQAELLRYTAHADLGLIPYEDAGLLNMRYCSPNKLFEFIEAKIPICASRLPELTRLVTENGIGAAYSMHTPEEIAAAIRDCRQRCERGDFANAQRDNARRKFGWPGQSKRLLALYEQLGV